MSIMNPQPDQIQQPRLRRRLPRSRRTTVAYQSVVKANPGQFFDQIAAFPFVGRALNVVPTHPRVLQIMGILMGLGIMVLALRPVVLPLLLQPLHESEVTAPVRGPSADSVSITALSTAEIAVTWSDDQALVALVAGYNQASITAANVGRPEAIAPFVAPDGKAWSQIQAEYKRRAARGESHQPALTRWGLLSLRVQEDTATVETQEQWDDFATVGGMVVSSQRGILTRNVYTLRRDSHHRWQITTVDSTLVIG